MRNRRIMVGLFAALAVVAVARHPSADIQILMHDVADPTPHRVKAAIDIGLVGISVLVTWTGEHLR